MGLWVEDLHVKVQERSIVCGLSFRLEKGKILGLFGPNGSGKSTAFYAIAGLCPPSQGKVWLMRQGEMLDTTLLPLFAKVRLGLGYLPQDRSLLMDLSVEENIWAVIECQEAQRKDKNFLDYLLDCFGLNGLRHRQGRFLSGGERRRCELACLLAHEPSYLLLDEPFAGIDPISIKQIQAILRSLKQHHAILITDHQVLETMNICDEVLVMRHGRVLTQGLPGDILSHPEVQAAYLGSDYT